MTDEIIVVVVADDPLVRGGLEALLPDAAEVARAVASDHDLVQVVLDEDAEVVLWDGAGDVPTPTRLRDLEVPVVVLVPDDGAASDALRAGAVGVLTRQPTSEELHAALVAARASLITVHPTLRSALAAVPSLDEGPIDPLTPREEEVLELLAEGRSNREIALALDISVHTAKFHVDRLLAKLDASGRTDAVVRAVRLGVLRL